MAEYLIQDTTLSGIADAIRAKTGKTDAIYPADMATEISGITTGTSDSSSISIKSMVERSFTSLDIPNDITKIGPFVFAGSQIERIDAWPENLTEIGQNAFEMTNNLTYVPPIPANVQFQNSAFRSSGPLENLKILTNKLSYDVFNSSNIVSVEFDNSEDVDSGDYMFAYTNYLNYIKLPRATKIPYGFCMGSSVETVEFHSDYNYNRLDNNAFTGCNNLKNIQLPAGLKEIGWGCFESCPFDYIELPNTLEYIDGYVFSQCANLPDIYIPPSVTYVGDYLFGEGEYGMNKQIYCGAASKPDGWSDMWAGDGNTVIWGYTPINATINFVTNNADITVPSISGVYITSDMIPTLSSSDPSLRFSGWYTDSEFNNKLVLPFRPSSQTITLYAKWRTVTTSGGYNINNETTGFITNSEGQITGVSEHIDTDTVYIDRDVVDLRSCITASTVIIGQNCNSIAASAFGNNNIGKVIFLKTSDPYTIGGDVFASTWDPTDFKVYVPDVLYDQYSTLTAEYWITAIVNNNKLARISDIDMSEYDLTYMEG